MKRNKNIYSNNRRRRKKKKIKLIPLTIIILFFLSFPYAVYTQAKSFKLKNDWVNLNDSINEKTTKNADLKSQNEKLLATLEDTKSEYEQALENAKIAYLTFDDGPSDNTMTILNILDKYNVKATFFVIGHPGLEHLYKEIVDRGHVVANHTFGHDYDYVYSSVDNFKSDVNKLNEFIKNATGTEPPKLLRYPGGSINTVSWDAGGKEIMPKIIKAMDEEGYSFFDWNVDSTDATGNGIPKSNIVNRILTDSKYVKKANILMHDTNAKGTTVEALPEIIEGLKAQGFIFDVVSHDSFKPQHSKVLE